MTRSTRSARRAAAGVVVFVGCLLAVAGCYPPINPLNRPTPVEGAENGLLEAAQLSEITATCSVNADAAPSFRAMVRAARKSGVTIYGGSCYRDLAGQIAVREEWCALDLCDMAAVPGTSSHGWGKAVDLRDADGSLTFTSAGYLWMEANAWLYGWNHPGWAAADSDTPEAWHWEWVGDGGTMFPGQPIPVAY